MPVTYDYAGKTVLVTGAGTGIGFAVAREFAKSGATVTLAGHLKDQIEPAAESLRALTSKDRIRSVVADVTQDADMERAVAVARGPDGHLDFAIANAGSAVPGPIMMLGKEIWDYVNTLNITGTALTIKHAALAMKAKGGRIVTVSSAAATKICKWMAPYSASKAAVEMLTQCAAVELAPFKINVNCISPGWIKTESAAMVSTPAMMAQVNSHTLQGEGAEPVVIAYAALHLCSDNAAFLTGDIMQVTGGMHVAVGEDFYEVAAGMYGEEVMKQYLGPAKG